MAHRLRRVGCGKTDMPIRWYISPYIGTGAANDHYRTNIDDLISGGEEAIGSDQPQRRYFIRRVDSSVSTHAAILADGHTPISPLMTTEDIDSTYGGMAAGLRAAIEAACDQRGIDISWMDSSTTLRQLIRRIIMLCWLGQQILGEKHPVMKALLGASLDTTVAQLTTAQRDAAKTWMQNKGLAIGWITASTTIRQIISHILTNLDLRVRLRGQEF